MEKSAFTRRGFMKGTAGGLALAAAGSSMLSVPASAQTQSAFPQHANNFGFNPGGLIPPDRIGAQIFTVRSLLSEEVYGLERTIEMMADAGLAQVGLSGDFYGYSPEDLVKLFNSYGIAVEYNHFGPRAMDGENLWYMDDRRHEIFEDAKRLGLENAGTGHYYNVPLTIEGFTEFARNLNIWGEEANKAGLKFFFHNHDAEFTRYDNKPIYDILLEETDPDLVFFCYDIGWAYAAGEDVVSMVQKHQSRFPYFHVKDIVRRVDGIRDTKPKTLATGNKFDFADVGSGEIDWQEVFSNLDNPSQHLFLIEHDDAGATTPPEGMDREAANPAGPANTIWSGRKHLAGLTAK